MTTFIDLINQIDRQLIGHYSRPLFDVPASTYTDSATTVTLTTTTQVSVGAILDVGMELMYVTAFNTGTKVATVIRGFLGTQARAGLTTDLVRINPKVPTIAMWDSILDELWSWDERLFRVEQETVVFGAADTAVEANPTVDPYRVLSFRPQPYNTVDHRKWAIPEFRRTEAATEFGSGFSLSLLHPFGLATSVDVVYAVPFDFSTITADAPGDIFGYATDVDLVGDLELTEGMVEILKWGALSRLVAGKETGRLDSWATTRADIEQAVPATALLQASAEYEKKRNMAYDREVRRLLSRYPFRTAG